MTLLETFLPRRIVLVLLVLVAGCSGQPAPLAQRAEPASAAPGCPAEAIAAPLRKLQSGEVAVTCAVAIDGSISGCHLDGYNSSKAFADSVMQWLTGPKGIRYRPGGHDLPSATCHRWFYGGGPAGLSNAEP
jgi:hypothetical protein